MSAAVTSLWATLRTARGYRHTLPFLFAFTVYNDGVQTMISLATQFGNAELKIPIAALTAAILMVQFVAFAGSLVFKRVASHYGAKRTLLVCLLIWGSVVLYAYALMYTAAQFFVMLQLWV